MTAVGIGGRSLARIANWLRTTPRSSHDWFNYRRRLRLDSVSFGTALGCLERDGIKVERGQSRADGVRFVAWIDSQRKTLRKALSALDVVELDFDPPETPKRRLVRRGRVQ